MSSLKLKGNPAADAYNAPVYADAMASTKALAARALMLQDLKQRFADKFAQIEAMSAPGSKAVIKNGFDTTVAVQAMSVKMGAQNPALQKALPANDQVLATVAAKKAAAAEVKPGQEPSQPMENSLKAKHPFRPA